MKTVFDLLEQIEKRPYMYMAFREGNREQELRDLEMLLIGYSAACWNHEQEEPGLNFLRNFSHYLRERFGWSASTGPIGAVLREAGNADEAWQTFWRLVWEFHEAVKKGQWRASDS